MELGKRLAKVASLVLPVDTMADVGCDHGYLSIYLTEQKRCNHIIAMDVNKGPLEKARENIQKYGYDDYIETRLSDGLNRLQPGEAQGYVCAGMGGPLALQILWNDKDKVSTMSQVILQPQSELWLVRRTLKQWGFVTEKEDIEYEDGKYYFMMRIRPVKGLSDAVLTKEEASLFEDIRSDNESESAGCSLSERKLSEYAYELFAKELLDARNMLLYEYIEKEIKRLTDICDSLEAQETSLKCQKRLNRIKMELTVHRWALERYEL